MKKTFFFAGSLLVISNLLFSCKGKDSEADVAPLRSSTEIPVHENNVPDGTNTITYSVHVRASSQLAARVAGLSNATVTVSHVGGRTSATTDASGIAVFPGLKRGKVSVFVSADGFLSGNFTEELVPTDAYLHNDTEQVEMANTEIILPKIGAELRGKVVGDLDFDPMTDNAPVPAGTKIIATVSSDLQPNAWVATTNSSGEFSFSGLPEGVDVSLKIDFKNFTRTNPVTEKQWTIPAGPHKLNLLNPKALGTILATSN